MEVLPSSEAPAAALEASLAVLQDWEATQAALGGPSTSSNNDSTKHDSKRRKSHRGRRSTFCPDLGEGGGGSTGTAATLSGASVELTVPGTSDQTTSYTVLPAATATTASAPQHADDGDEDAYLAELAMAAEDAEENDGFLDSDLSDGFLSASSDTEEVEAGATPEPQPATARARAVPKALLGAIASFDKTQLKHKAAPEAEAEAEAVAGRAPLSPATTAASRSNTAKASTTAAGKSGKPRRPAPFLGAIAAFDKTKLKASAAHKRHQVRLHVVPNDFSGNACDAHTQASPPLRCVYDAPHSPVTVAVVAPSGAALMARHRGEDAVGVVAEEGWATWLKCWPQSPCVPLGCEAPLPPMPVARVTRLVVAATAAVDAGAESVTRTGSRRERREQCNTFLKH